MSQIIKNKATICIVNYKTPDFIKICLRSIRKFTHCPFEVIVVDNNSQDESVEYLRSINWIRLIERRISPNEPQRGGYAHGAGLETGLENCNTEFFISVHSDTFVHKAGWLTELLGYFNNDPKIACVGSGKIELTAAWQQLIKKATDFRTLRRKLMHTPDPLGKYRYYNRTICCLYRTEILRRENLSFLTDNENGLTAGKKLYFELVDREYKTIELPQKIMARYIIHLAHATQAVNPQEFSLRSKTIRKYNRISRRILTSPVFQSIINDDSLDR